VNKAIAIGFMVAGFIAWYFPGFNGYFFAPSDVSDGEGLIAGSVLTVGAAVLWFMHPRSD